MQELAFIEEAIESITCFKFRVLLETWCINYTDREVFFEDQSLKIMKSKLPVSSLYSC